MSDIDTEHTVVKHTASSGRVSFPLREYTPVIPKHSSYHHHSHMQVTFFCG